MLSSIVIMENQPQKKYLNSFSEVIREVDYFIQSCSIGLDLSLDLHGFPEDMLQYYQVGYPYSNSQLIATRGHTLDLIVSKLNIAAQ